MRRSPRRKGRGSLQGSNSECMGVISSRAHEGNSLPSALFHASAFPAGPEQGEPPRPGAGAQEGGRRTSPPVCPALTCGGRQRPPSLARQGPWARGQEGGRRAVRPQLGGEGGHPAPSL